MTSFTVETRQRSQMVDVTDRLNELVAQSGMDAGYLLAFVPHTTAGITINEHADPDVARDMLDQLEQMVPWEQPLYRHNEGNSAAHVKATLVGSSVLIPIQSGRLSLGTWQGVFFCEFDGPRTRYLWISVQAG